MVGAVVAASILARRPAWAATCDVNYTGPSSGAWDTPGNWDTNAVPTTAQRACIPSGKGTIVVANGVTATVLNLTSLSGIQVASGGLLTIFDGTAGFSNSVTDLTVVGPTGIFQTIGSSVAMAGQVVVDGHLTCNVRLDSGSISGSGSVGGAVTNVAGTVRPGGAGSVGTMMLGGPYTQEAGGTLEIDIASDVSYDQLFGPSSAHSILGSIVVTVLGAYSPASGTNFFFFAQNATSVTIGAQVTPSTFVVTALPHGAELTFSPPTTTTSSSTTTTSSTTTSTSTGPSSTSSTTTTTSSSSTTTTHAPATTTTTTVQTGCDGPRAATFSSIDCRLDALIAAVDAATDIPAKLANVFRKQLGTARDRKQTAEQLAATEVSRKVLGTLKQSRRKVIAFAHRVRSLNGRHGIPTATATPLAASADEISSDLKTLRDLCRQSSASECGAP
ncbi:MAG TPA: hypothetical protein VGR62_00915 [Candidatus Binatia bacterium]|jgi:hypothetical protein|nr:hypothetical protein [Candidatus Binatia bacterium]